MKPQEILDHNDSGALWPVRDGPAFSDLQSAYGTALAVRRLRIARGEVPVGYKVGFTNRTIWSRYNVYAPIWGFVWNTTISYCDGAGNVPLARLCQPRIEPEAVFGFRATPPNPVTLDDLFDALDWVARVSKSSSLTPQAGSSLHRKRWQTVVCTADCLSGQRHRSPNWHATAINSIGSWREPASVCKETANSWTKAQALMCWIVHYMP